MELSQVQFDNLIAKGLKPIDRSLDAFAEACYDMNSYDDLVGALDDSQPADKTDMAEWGLTEAEWRDNIKQALEQAMYYFAE